MLSSLLNRDQCLGNFLMNFMSEESVWMIFICASIVSNYRYHMFLSNLKYEWGW